MGFVEYLNKNGIDKSERLTEFICDFLNDPGLFFNLAEDERTSFERNMDHALSLFSDSNVEESVN